MNRASEGTVTLQEHKVNEKGNKEELIQKLIKSKEESERAKTELERSYSELQLSKDRLVQSEKMAFAGRMAASIAHEIRNPLNMLVMSSQLLQDRLGKKNPNRELVDVVMRNLERIDHLVTELVNCARPPKLRIRNYNIHTIIKSVIDTIKEKCKAQNIKVVRDFDEEIPKVRIDREHIEQAILNIAKNAIESMQRGGTLAFSTSCEEGHVIIGITDTGRGIPDKDMIRIFDPFFTTKKDGTGLGLAICYAIVASHNGFINLKSKRGETRFTIKLPV